MRNAFAKELLKLAIDDPSILLITGDLGFGVLDDFAKTIPNQYINSGINEQSMMSMAAGLASRGYRPFVYSIGNFPTFRCLEQIRNDVCYMDNSVTIVSIGAGVGYGNLGYSHHAIEDISVMRALPNMRIFSPGDSDEVLFVLDKILVESKPAYLRLGKGGEKNFGLIGKNPFNDLREVTSGIDGVIAFTGGIGTRVLDAIGLLKEDGIEPRVISVPALSEESILELLHICQNKVLLTVEEHLLKGGFGSMVLEIAAERGSNCKISRIGLDSKLISKLGSQQFLLDQHGLTSKAIYQKFKSLYS